MEKYLKTFKEFIKPFGTDNVAIGGTFALKAHGLIMTREAMDLDLILFKPTSEQKRYLDSMSFFEIEDRNLPSSVTKYDQRSYKFKKNNLTIDILISNDEVPKDLLLFNFDGTYYKVQSIKNTIDAKRNYTYGNSKGTANSYVREKDVNDFIDLKNSNFNF